MVGDKTLFSSCIDRCLPATLMNYFESEILQPRCTTLISVHSLINYQKHIHGGTEDESESSLGEGSTYTQFIYLFVKQSAFDVLANGWSVVATRSLSRVNETWWLLSVVNHCGQENAPASLFDWTSTRLVLVFITDGGKFGSLHFSASALFCCVSVTRTTIFGSVQGRICMKSQNSASISVTWFNSR